MVPSDQGWESNKQLPAQVYNASKFRFNFKSQLLFLPQIRYLITLRAESKAGPNVSTLCVQHSDTSSLFGLKSSKNTVGQGYLAGFFCLFEALTYCFCSIMYYYNFQFLFVSVKTESWNVISLAIEVVNRRKNNGQKAMF